MCLDRPSLGIAWPARDHRGRWWIYRRSIVTGGPIVVRAMNAANWLVAVVCLELLCGVSCAADPGSCETGTPETSRAGRAILSATNLFRRSEDLSQLAENPTLTEVAVRHARLLCEHGRLSHEVEGGLGAGERVRTLSRRLFYFELGENLYRKTLSRGVLGFDLETAAAFGHEAQFAWEKSSGHRRNLLTPTFNRVGIGVAHARGRFYAVQLLATLAAELASDLPARQPLSKHQQVELGVLIPIRSGARVCLVQASAQPSAARHQAPLLVCDEMRSDALIFDYRPARPGKSELRLRLPDGREAIGPRFEATD